MIPTLETERLILRAPSQSDFDAEAEFYASARSGFVGGPLERDQAWRVFATMIGHWSLRGFGHFAVEERDTGLYCGLVGPWFPEGWPEPEIGWSIHARAEGRGIAREAAMRARRYVYEELGWTTAISLIDPQNLRSIALAERLGAVYESNYQHVRYGLMGIYRHPTPDSLAAQGAA
ncbi:MAG: GNAT family N-acetyltransferase [Pseudomonadota bacterium]